MSNGTFGQSGSNVGGMGPPAGPPQPYPPPQGTAYRGTSTSYASIGPRRGAEGRGRGQGQRYGDGAPNSRGGFASAHRGYHYGSGPSLVEDGPRTKPSSYVTPYDAVQAQPAQHGASVVRSGSAATEGGSILFFSSVQKKGGAFTASERETYAQLRQSRAIPSSNQRGGGGRGGNVVGSGIMTRNVARQFEELERRREATELGVVRRAVTASKRSRFALGSESDEDEDDEEEEDGEEGKDSEEEDGKVKVEGGVAGEGTAKKARGEVQGSSKLGESSST
ncbi:hypothetical protein ABB37_06613 [Leptomonas pyrrhocoris]|uniref:Uncharacterized protein n=1 Tax=Leptomonas pyrrhocoris TaxID=157538 RepID=A0A0M9FX56_LEPPY|nr:hypothetical protein ABB37_06613 [Leptomonas pyrrhocoris]XP_015656222.1 hypothetical protein ABB37_06613 [Leptomonas pyrrhocoris]KPA77782.1 hypothetical protein ABB37_06613 [Leptomonas pyrrhocoris]KPA77783.1 hypothetical protein ABB37_06613 [Leptomonas pyrrhocoris]|eukprot:XP_015656221.1 hypothetical protein ABB37_06613 [Leptomonas pyrrhocoris]